ncbi:MAG: peptide deformylase [Candidatus Ryanbacteria bacterium CG10_big_fil_rev_8_21_14_0_10_43_42]|uniref:Peptide deformylase n=1 Tax=Candidatus Ryanbacteria bacterium CG10_big_fil_rev_8_21_14_0_10_43_42 TaxID=1974864 RepID=A0A2M8KW36_9BACT|nr:MAG: peptide deformylase [Candidatus Ryanbacteria bacterium CG10_big_fil_rev_8_21_14_0_10_43_42]
MEEKKSIVIEPATVLHRETRDVPLEYITSGEIKRVLKEMKQALRSTDDGIGIAAPQIGYSWRIFLASEEALVWDGLQEEEKEEYRKKKKKWDYYVFINPIITRTSKKTTDEMEGCLSVPRIYGRVRRHEKVTITAYDEQGKKFMRGTSGLYARVMQHETDHLKGMLFIEKAKDIQKIKDNGEV